jgi:biopolymer transport protein ExbB/TolQ
MVTGWYVATHYGSKAILMLMIGLSIWSIAIIIDRIRALRASDQAASFKTADDLIRQKDWKALKSWSTLNSSGIRAGAMRALLESGTDDAEKLDSAIRSYLISERIRLEKGFTTLATLASNATFIGLLGTVLGIIQAFSALGATQGAAASVMTGISEALVATAVGLFVAIPASIAYNALVRKVRLLVADCESLKDLYLSRQD